MTTKTQLDRHVDDYIKAFKADILSEETFTKNYMCNVENRKTEIIYSRNTPDNFVSKCLTLTRDTGNKLYQSILTRNIEINLTAAMYSLLFKDLQQLFSEGFEVVESNTKRIVLRRPHSLFKTLKQDIAAMYHEYVESTTQAQKEAYLSIDKVDEYVTAKEAEALEQALAKKYQAIQEQLEKSL